VVQVCHERQHFSCPSREDVHLENFQDVHLENFHLKLETWQQRLQQVHAQDAGRRRSDEQQSPLTPQYVGDGEAGEGEAPGG
jgi:hypothetical protein